MWSSWLCAVAWACLVSGVVLQRFQSVHFGMALGLFALGALLAFIAGVGSLWSLKTSPLAWFVLVLGFAPLLTILIWVGPGLKGPAIHDIATTPGMLSFDKAVTLRGADANPLDGPSEEVIKQQRAAYPDLAPLKTSADASSVFDAAIDQARRMGWQITEQVRPTHFEAYEKTALFGFVDDIKVQVTDGGDVAEVNVRSVSRVGRSDLGANAERIHEFLSGLERQLAP